MRRAIFVPLLLIAALPAQAATAQDEVLADGTVVRAIPVAVYGNDACPKGEDDEIVVCAHHPESERYRIPEGVREQHLDATDRSWTDKVEGMEDSLRYTIPGSCSAVGTGGQFGCTAAMLRQWFAERRQPQAQ